MVIHYAILTCRYTDKNKLLVNTTKNTDAQNILLYSFIHFIHCNRRAFNVIFYINIYEKEN